MSGNERHSAHLLIEGSDGRRLRVGMHGWGVRTLALHGAWKTPVRSHLVEGVVEERLHAPRCNHTEMQSHAIRRRREPASTEICTEMAPRWHQSALRGHSEGTQRGH